MNTRALLWSTALFCASHGASVVCLSFDDTASISCFETGADCCTNNPGKIAGIDSTGKDCSCCCNARAWREEVCIQSVRTQRQPELKLDVALRRNHLLWLVPSRKLDRLGGYIMRRLPNGGWKLRGLHDATVGATLQFRYSYLPLSSGCLVELRRG